MTAYSTGNPLNSATSPTGSIDITISENGSGGGAGDTIVDLLVAVQNSSYSFTGGTPAATSTFGTNGARWDRISVNPTQSAQRIYNWTRSVNVTSQYVLILLSDDGSVDTNFGTIPGMSSP